jgi:hypothetical protein
MIDPPSGWQYGFPKPVPSFKTQQDFQKWMVIQGYPQSLIDEGMLQHCRYLSVPIESSNG